jgi:hypothetical protein
MNDGPGFMGEMSSLDMKDWGVLFEDLPGNTEYLYYYKKKFAYYQ